MNDDNLTDLLEARAADVPVGPPPLAQMHRDAVRRRRSYVAGLAAAAAVVVTVGAVAVWPDGSGSERDSVPLASDSPSQPASDDVPPAGFRWVGIGQAAIAVPDSWATNAIGCGTPQTDTVVVDVSVIEACAMPYPKDTSSVWLRERQPVDEIATWTPVEVDGEEALRSPDERFDGFRGATLYRASIYLRGRDVVFEASSTVSQEVVDEVLSRITILDTLVAVPGVSPANYGTTPQSRAGENYVRMVREAGLVAEVVTERSQATAGFVLGVSPAPGTVVEPGTVVTVTVAA